MAKRKVKVLIVRTKPVYKKVKKGFYFRTCRVGKGGCGKCFKTLIKTSIMCDVCKRKSKVNVRRFKL